MTSRSSASSRPAAASSDAVFTLAVLLLTAAVGGVRGDQSSVRVSKATTTGGGGGAWSRPFACMPPDHENKTTPAFNKASISLVYLRVKTEACVTDQDPVAAGTSATMQRGVRSSSIQLISLR